MEGQSCLCSSCGLTQASWFSQQPAALLCQACLPSHFTKYPGSERPCYPIQSFAYREIPGYLDRLAERSNMVPLACEELRKNLTAIDSAIGGLHKGAGEASDAQDYVRMETQTLQSLRAELQVDIEAAIAEVQASLYEDQPTFHSKYAPALRAADLERLSLFTYRMDTAQSVGRLTYWSPDSQDVPGHVLPQINGSVLKCYDLLTGRTTATTLTTYFVHAVFCLVERDTVLCVGGSDGAKVLTTASVVELSTAKVTPQQAMLTARYLPGIIKRGSFAYIFGGYSDSPLTACEKFGIARRAWSALPDMHHERACFSPCALGDDIYLPEVRFSRVLEVFSVSTEAFKALSVLVPTDLDSNSVSFIVDGELTIICRGQMGKWRINAEQTIRVSPISLVSNCPVSMIPPMRSGRQVFWVDCNSANVVKFDLDTQTVSQ